MIGQRFGNYRAVSLLGEGGMGAVYLAEHPEIGRRVAVKVLRPEMIRDPHLLVRFLNEARAANAIRHPNIIEILDSGTTPEGTPYLVMELLEGEVLSGRIKRLGRLSLKEALEFAYQAASALAAAHAKGIVHRDLKPDNLFIVPDPSDPARELIKVLDFGIAKLQSMSTGGGMQTRTGTLMGTPVYMSPEQCLGTRTIDHRSDIYAMGIILYEMLTGRPPFLSDGFGELVNMHLNVLPQPPRELNQTISPAVEAVVLKALQKAPADRQQSATELQADIRTAAGKSIVIRGSSSPDLISETMPGAARASAGGTIALPVSLGGSPTTMTGATGERFIPTEQRAPRRKGPLIAVAVVVVAIAGAAALLKSRPGLLSGGATGDGKTTVATKTTDEAHAGGEGKTAPDTTGGGVATDREKKAAAVARVSIDSQPSGAKITDVASGTLIGTTPLVVERPVSIGTLMLRVEKPGFTTLTRAFDFKGDNTEIISLAMANPEGTSAETSHPKEKAAAKERAREESREKAKETTKETKKTAGHGDHPTAPTVDEPAKL